MGRKSWRKLWQDALRSSPKYRRLTASVKGCYLECLLLANDDGKLLLRPGVPLTVADIAFEMNTREHTAEKWVTKLLDVGLLAGDLRSICIPLWSHLQGDSRKWAPNETGEVGQSNELQRNSATQEKRREEKREETSSRAREPEADNGLPQDIFVRLEAILGPRAFAQIHEVVAAINVHGEDRVRNAITKVEERKTAEPNYVVRSFGLIGTMLEEDGDRLDPGPRKAKGRFRCAACNDALSFEKSLERGYCGPCWRNAGGTDD